MKWVDSIGKSLIKEVKVEVYKFGIFHTQRKCCRCSNFFIYTHSDDAEKLKRKYYFGRSGNMDLCMSCDPILTKNNNSCK